MWKLCLFTKAVIAMQASQFSIILSFSFETQNSTSLFHMFETLEPISVNEKLK